MEKHRSSRYAGCVYVWMVISVSNWLLMDSPRVQRVCTGPRKPHPSPALLLTVPALPTWILHRELLKGLLNSKTGYAVCSPLVRQNAKMVSFGCPVCAFWANARRKPLCSLPIFWGGGLLDPGQILLFSEHRPYCSDGLCKPRREMMGLVFQIREENGFISLSETL